MNGKTDTYPDAEGNIESLVSPDNSVRDTVVVDETADLSSQVTSPRNAKTPPTPAPNRLKLKKETRKRSHRKKAPSNLTIVVSAQESETEESIIQEQLQTAYKGIPSCLTSLLFHLTFIFLLAVLNIAGNQDDMVNLFAESTEPVAVESIANFDLQLEPEEIETISQQPDVENEILLESTDLEVVLNEALVSSSLENAIQGGQFESIASGGTEETLSNEQSNEGGNAKFFGINSKGAKFVFVVDCSDSMNDFGRWRLAINELRNSIEKLKSNQKFLILLYNSGYIAMNRKAQLVSSTSSERKRAFRWLGRNQPTSGTFAAEALGKALALNPDAVFLLSDGEFMDRMSVFRVLESFNNVPSLSTDEDDYQKTPVHTIALGSHDGRYTMERIAEENNGQFKLVD